MKSKTLWNKFLNEIIVYSILISISIVFVGCAGKYLYSDIGTVKQAKQVYSALTKWYYDSIYTPLYNTNLHYKYLTPKAKVLLETKINPLADKFKHDLIQLGLILEQLPDDGEVSISTQTRLDQLEVMRKALLNYLIQLEEAKLNKENNNSDKETNIKENVNE